MTQIRAVVVIACVVALGCARAEPGPVEPIAEEVQPVAEPAAEAPVVAEPPPPPAPQQEEPGTLKVTATFAGSSVDAPIEVRRAGQQEVIESATLGGGRTEAVFTLPPGRYDIRALFPGAIDGAADVREGLRIRPGETVSHEFTFESVSRVTIPCRRGGRNVSGTIKLRRPGEDEYRYEIRCGDRVAIGGGLWEAEVTVGTGRGRLVVQVTLQIPSGGTGERHIEIHDRR